MEHSFDILLLFISYGLNLVSIFIFVALIYNRYQAHELGYVFTYFMFNTIIFFISILFSSLSISVGFAFGLFAVFGIMRYRTEPIPIREMTYLFGSITLGLLNGIAYQTLGLEIVAFCNGIILLLAFILESILVKYPVMETRVRYEIIENIKPENHAALMEDLRNRTGLDIRRIKIDRINFLRDTARIKVYHMLKKDD